MFSRASHVGNDDVMGYQGGGVGEDCRIEACISVEALSHWSTS